MTLYTASYGDVLSVWDGGVMNYRFNHFTKTPQSFLPYRQEDKSPFQRQRRNGNVLLVHIAPQHGNIGGALFTIGPQNI